MFSYSVSVLLTICSLLDDGLLLFTIITCRIIMEKCTRYFSQSWDEVNGKEIAVLVCILLQQSIAFIPVVCTLIHYILLYKTQFTFIVGIIVKLPGCAFSKFSFRSWDRQLSRYLKQECVKSTSNRKNHFCGCAIQKTSAVDHYNSVFITQLHRR